MEQKASKTATMKILKLDFYKGKNEVMFVATVI